MKYLQTHSTAKVLLKSKIESLICEGFTKEQAIDWIYEIMDDSRMCDTCGEWVPIDWPYNFCNNCILDENEREAIPKTSGEIWKREAEAFKEVERFGADLDAIVGRKNEKKS